MKMGLLKTVEQNWINHLSLEDYERIQSLRLEGKFPWIFWCEQGHYFLGDFYNQWNEKRFISFEKLLDLLDELEGVKKKSMTRAERINDCESRRENNLFNKRSG